MAPELRGGVLVDVTDTGHGIANPAADLEEVALSRSQHADLLQVGAVERPGLSRSSSLGQDPDHIEVSLEEGAGTPTDEVLQRAGGFFASNNENFSVTWADASRMISDVEQDPSRPPLPGLNKVNK